MGWLDKLFKRKPDNVQGFAQSIDGHTPIYTTFGTNIYASDVVQQVLKCIVDEMKKLNPTHVRYKNNDPVPIVDDIQMTLNNPNPIMTTSDFLEKTVWMLLLNYNAFVVPIIRRWTDTLPNGKKVEMVRCEALYPIQPTNVIFLEDPSGTLYVEFSFRNEYKTTLRYEDVIHIRWNYSVNQYMGGNELGRPDHQALLDTLDLNDKLLKGIAKSMNASYAINGVVKYKSLIDSGKTEKALKEMEQKLRNSESGFLPLDLAAEFIPLERKTSLVDEETLKFIDEKILRNWGVPLAILTGDYTKEQYEAFYQKTLEPLIISFSQAFTKKLFSARERSYGNKIEFYPKELIFMTMSQKIDMLNLLAPTGAVFENEKRTILGLMPLPELAGQRYMSLNWVDTEIANQYQMGKMKNNTGGQQDEEVQNK